MYRVISLFGVLFCLFFVAAEPVTAPDAPSDGEVNITGDESDDSGDSAPSDRPQEPAAQMVDNKVYQSWSKYGVGSAVDISTTIRVPGEDNAPQTMSMSSVTTSKDIKPEAITVESTFTGGPGGQQVPNQTDRITAKVPQGSEYAPTGFRGSMTESGKESLTIDGKSYECLVFDFNGTDEDGLPLSGKLWVNDDVPGCHVKGLIDIDLGGQKMTVELLVTKITLK